MKVCMGLDFLTVFTFVENVKVHLSKRQEAMDEFEFHCCTMTPLFSHSSMMNIPFDVDEFVSLQLYCLSLIYVFDYL